MSYKLNKPYTEKQKTDFIVEYNHNQGLKIEETNKALYALQPWEVLEDDKVIDNREAWEAQKAQEEKERIAKLSLTRGDVFRGLLQAKGVTRAEIRAMIENNELLSLLQKEMALIDFDEALNFYRGNTLIDTLGLALGISSEQLDRFFEDGNYEHLLPVEEDSSAEPQNDETEVFNLEE